MKQSTTVAVGFSLSLVLSGFVVDAPAAQEREVGDLDPGIHMQRGDALADAGMLSRARTEYRIAARLFADAGRSPRDALRRVAYIHYGQENYRDAVQVLDLLAKRAAAVGDLGAEAWARADAIWILGKETEMTEEAVEEIDRRTELLRRLLASPDMPKGVRAEIVRKRLVNGDL